jgi:flagellar basal-body rod protein FlgG
MMKGMYIAASGMSYQIEQLNEASANLANVNTPGYKKTALIGESFQSLVHQFTQPTPNNRAGVGVHAVGQARIDQQGALTKTSNPLNLALSGPGYFQIQDANGTVQVTRNGDFRMDNQGFLSTQTGERVLGVDNQPIQVGAAGSRDLRIRQDGTLMAGLDTLAQVKVVDPQEANNQNFPISTADAPAMAGGYNVEQGYLENSTVSVISEMVNMVTINKAFNFNQKAITTQDNLLNKTVNDLGRVQ